MMVDHLVAAGLVKRRGAVRTDSTHVLAAVRTLNRTELVTETLRAALEQLALTLGISPDVVLGDRMPEVFQLIWSGSAVRTDTTPASSATIGSP
ncbi:hypothetical protein OG607_01085 [Streptomyces sp. NBC_01537]|uniref:hypothetical protein n=1 Tax=Streptomyces sp. NBC_01537 TaxID=2903896 RepID=UPI003865F988